ncbi:MAG: hypothetical protein M3M98_08560, partial [Nitrospirota bacterium]|nr:hypothetical protein [Nitrospirota bacterium]
RHLTLWLVSQLAMPGVREIGLFSMDWDVLELCPAGMRVLYENPPGSCHGILHPDSDDGSAPEAPDRNTVRAFQS